MIVNYDKEKGWNTIFNSVSSKVPEASEKVKEFFDLLSLDPDTKSWGSDELIDFAKSCNVSEKSLIEFLGKAESGERTLMDYQSYLKSTTKQTTAFANAQNVAGNVLKTVGSFAVNALASWAVSEAIGLAIKGIYNIVKADEIAIEKGEEAQNAIKETFDTYKSKVSTVTTLGKQFADDTESIKTTSDAVDSLTKKYAELKKGVNPDNSNATLSSNEYQQYLDISNQLADSFPSLVTGSDAAGNSILNLGTNASTAATELERLLETQMTLAHTDIVDESADAFKGAYTESKEIDNEISMLKAQNDILKETSESVSMSKKEIKESLKNGTFTFSDISTSASEGIKDALNAYKGAYGKVRESITDYNRADGKMDYVSYNIEPIVDEDKLNEATDAIAEQLNANADIVNAQLGETEAEIVAKQAKQKEIWSTFAEGTVRPYLETATQLLDVPSELTNAVENNLTNIDWGKLYSTYNGDADEMLLKEFVVPLQNMEKPAQEALVKAFSLDPNELSISEYEKQVNEALKAVSDDESVRDQWKEKFGFDNLMKDATEQADALKKEFKNIDESIIDSLSGEDRELAYQIVIEDEDFNGSWQDVMNKVEELKDSASNGVSFSLSSFQVEVANAIALIDTLNAAMVNSYSGKGLSVTYDEDEDGFISLTGDIANLMNAYKDLEGYDPEVLFERTANGVHINREALRALQAQEEALNKEKWLEQRKSLTDQLTKATNNLKDAQSSGDKSAISTAQANINSLQDQINTIDLLSAAYDGATSAYQKWLNAQSNGEEGDMFRNVSETMKERGDELFKEGRYNTEEFRAIADYFSYEDLDIAPMEKLVEAYQNAANARDAYFTGNKQGIDNFMADVNRISQEEGFNWTKDVGDGIIEFETGADEEIAQRFNLSKEAVQTLLRAATEYTDTIRVGDTSGSIDYSASIEEMKSKADEARQKLEELKESGKNLDLNFNFNSTDTDDLEAQIERAKSNLEQFKNQDGVVDLSIDGAEEAITILQTLIQQKQQVSQPEIMKIDTSGLDDSVSNVIAKLQEYQSAVNELNGLEELQSAGIQVDTSQIDDARAKVETVFSEIQGMSQDGSLSINADVSVDTSSMDSLNGDLASMTPEITAKIVPDTSSLNTSTSSSLTSTVTFIKDSSAIDGYQPADKTAKVTFSKDSSEPDNYKPENKTAVVDYTLGTTPTYDPPNLTRTLTYNIEINGDAGLAGTAHKDGTVGGLYPIPKLSGRALAMGTLQDNSWLKPQWKTQKDNIALTGEEDQELVVKGNRWWTVGDNGAEFAHIPQGSVVFNAKQTKELFKNGFINSRGTSHLSGTAYSNGSWVFGDTGNGNLGGSGYTPSSSSSSSSSNTTPVSTNTADSINEATEAAEEFEEELDYIQIKIDRIERQIKSIELVAESAFETFTTRNNALKDQISATTSEISIQQQAYERYIQAANAVGLSEDYAAKIRDGLIDLETITDETLNDSISKYQDYYEKALDCKDAVEELKESVRELYQQEFDNLAEEYDHIVNLLEHNKNILEGYIDQSEAEGYITSTKYYSALIANEKNTLNRLNEEREQLIASLNNAMTNGDIEKYSDAW